jgi:hypothetical protein
MSRFTENPDEIVLRNVQMFHLESMNERTLWIGVYGEDGKIYHLNISADGDKLKYWWSDETVMEIAKEGIMKYDEALKTLAENEKEE